MILSRLFHFQFVAPLTIPVDEADSDPLIGMLLMEGYQLTVQVFEGGFIELSKVNTV